VASKHIKTPYGFNISQSRLKKFHFVFFGYLCCIHVNVLVCHIASVDNDLLGF
jgi:hypothetical protein